MAAVHLVHLTCFRWRSRNSTQKSSLLWQDVPGEDDEFPFDPSDDGDEVFQ